MWEGLVETERIALAQGHWDVVYVARQMRARNAYLHSAVSALPTLRLIPQVTVPDLVREPRYVPSWLWHLVRARLTPRCDVLSGACSMAEHAARIQSELVRSNMVRAAAR